MRLTAEDLRRSAHEVAKASSRLESAARRRQGARSVPGRVAFAISTARLSLTVLRAGVRLVRSHPLVGTVLIAGMVWGLSSPSVRRRFFSDD
jgi:hypothetical protein